MSIERISEGNELLINDTEDELNKMQKELAEKILQDAVRDIPDLKEDEVLFDAVMAQVLLKHHMEEQNKELELTPEKIEEVLNDELENCALLIDIIPKCIENQRKYKQLMDQSKEILSNIIHSVENRKVEQSEDDLRIIERKVRQKFKSLRTKLKELIEEWSGDYSSDVTDILSSLTKSNVEDTGSEDLYVDVKDYNRDLVQFLLSNGIVVWDKDQERIKLSV